MRPCGCSLQYDLRILQIRWYRTNYGPSQVINVPKLTEEDTTITVGNANGENLTIPVPKGIRVSFATPALHYNRENPLLGNI
jgi:hypothetical protein